MSTPPFLELPDGVARADVPTSRGPLAALDAPAAGEPRGTALLVPGFTGSKEDFLAVLAPLAARGWHVVAVDQRGQYETPGPDDEAAYALDVLAADVVEVLEGLRGPGGAPAHLVGHSLGGLVARAAVVSAPGSAASCTLLSSGPAAVPEHARGGLRALLAALPATPLATVWAVKEAQDRAAGWSPPDDVAAFVRRRFLATNPWALRAKAALLLSAQDAVDALAATGVPAAVVLGEHDDVWTPAEQAAMARRLSVQPVVLPACGHSPAAETPAAAAAALDAAWAAAA